MEALLQREANFPVYFLEPGVADRRLKLVEDIRVFIGRVYPDEDVCEIGSDYYELFARSVACLDKILATQLADSFIKSKAFPAACFLLASKFIKPNVMRISDSARLCGVHCDEMARVELFVFFYAGLNLFGITAKDYLAGLRADIPEEHVLPLAKELVASLYLVPYTTQPPSVVAAALLRATLPAELLGLDAPTEMSRFLLSMEGQREAVLCLAGRFKAVQATDVMRMDE